MEQREHQYLFSSGNACGKQNVNLVITTPLRDSVLLNGMDLLSYINNSNSISTSTWTHVGSNSNSAIFFFSRWRIIQNNSQFYQS